jgi:fumarate reductase flavoprotein subunit
MSPALSTATILTTALPADAPVVDVLIAGAGAAGLSAALAARDEGADTWVLERDAVPRGSTAMSQGAIMAAGTKSQAAAGIIDSPDALYADIMAKAEGGTDPALARAVADAAGPTVDWLHDRHHVPVAFDPKWQARSGHQIQRLHGPPSGTGEELINALAAAADRAGAQLISNARALAIYGDAHGRAHGLLIERPDGTREAIGCRALVLATCGFGGNPALIAAHIPAMARARYFGHDGNDGWGIMAGAALGGATADMTAYQGLGMLAEPHGVVVHLVALFQGGILVNQAGQRFEDELADVSGQGARILAQPCGIAWVVMNAAAHAAGLATHEMQQLAALGAIKTAPDLAGLAGLIGADPAVLAATLAQTNAVIAGVQPCHFGRRFGDVEALAAPFYAIKVTGALFHTQGGLVVDANARVLRADGTALPNLFAAGGTARSISGRGPTGYLPGAGLGMAVTLGRLAGRAAARLAAARLSA